MKKVIKFLLKNPKIYFFIQNVHRDFELERKTIKEKINLSEIKSVLDYGCGEGKISEIFENRCYVGVDIDFKFLNFARKKYNKNLVLIEEKLPFKNNSFDLIVLVSILHHIKKEKVIELLNNISHLLKSSGVLIISEPLSNKGQNYLTKFLMFLEERGREVYFFNEDEIREILAQIFKIRNEETVKLKIHSSQIYILEKKDG